MDKKPYPCCRTTHHAIDGALQLRKEARAADVRRVQVETYEVGVLQCGSDKYPQTPVEAKFSIPYTVAVAFVRGRVSLAEFTREAIEDPKIRELAGKVSVTANPLFSERYPERWGSRITAEMEDGRIVSCQVDDMSGSRAKPLTKEQEIGKFLGLAETVMEKKQASEIVEEVLNVEKKERILSI